MASVIEICNMGLSQIRSASINSLDESSLQAQQCKLLYPIVREQVLKEIDWGFNNRIEALAALSGITVFNWAYVWAFPSGCLHVNKLIRNIETVEAGSGISAVAMRLYDHRPRMPSDLPPVIYQILNVDVSGIDTRIIVSNESELRISYRRDVTDVNLFPVELRVTMSYLLGSYLAVAIAGSKEGMQLRKDCLALYAAFKTQARDNSANQQYVEPRESEYITVRES